MTVTTAEAARWAKIDEPAGVELADFQMVIDVVTAFVGERYVVAETGVPPVPDPPNFSATVNLAIKMQVARLWGRRSNPYGVAEFADIAALRIHGLDADVDVLLSPRWALA